MERVGLGGAKQGWGGVKWVEWDEMGMGWGRVGWGEVRRDRTGWGVV